MFLHFDMNCKPTAVTGKLEFQRIMFEKLYYRIFHVFLIQNSNLNASLLNLRFQNQKFECQALKISSGVICISCNHFHYGAETYARRI